MISINWVTKRITIPQADLTFISGVLYELNVNTFRLQLKDLEDGEDGILFPDTHRHNTEVSLSGVTYARTFEIINGYTVEFQNTGTPYTVRCTSANHNIGDVFIPGSSGVSLIIGNSAGLISVNTGGGGGASAAEIRDAVWNAILSSYPTSGSAGKKLFDTVLASVIGTPAVSIAADILTRASASDILLTPGNKIQADNSGNVNANVLTMANNSITASSFEPTTTSTYQAKVWFFANNETLIDYYTIVFFKNGAPNIVNGVPASITVTSVADGSVLLNNVSLTEVGTTGIYKYSTTAARMAEGTPYVIKVTATLDSVARVWMQPMGRDKNP